MMRVMRRGAGKKKPRATKVSEAELDALIEEATVDAYNESEQMIGFLTMLQEHLEMPFKTEVLGVEVTVEKVDLTDDDHIVAVCKRGKSRQTIPILDLPLPTPPPKGAEWIDAYRRWAPGG
jgi:calcium binding protein